MQVTLRWLIQRGLAVVPKSNSVGHQRENFSVSNSSVLATLNSSVIKHTNLMQPPVEGIFILTFREIPENIAY